MTINIKETSVNVLVHVLILFTILSSLFVFYITKVETKVIHDQISSAIQSNLYTSLQTADPTGSLKTLLKSLPLSTAATIYSQPSSDITVQNLWITHIPIFVIVTLILILIVSYISCGRCYNMLHVLGSNLIIFIFIGIVEFLFFTKITLNYVPAKPSLMTQQMYTTLQQSTSG